MCKVLKKLSSICNHFVQNSAQWTSKCDSQHSFGCQCDDEIACLVLRLFASNCVHSSHLRALNGSKVNCKCHFDGGRLWLHGCSGINTSRYETKRKRKKHLTWYFRSFISLRYLLFSIWYSLPISLSPLCFAFLSAVANDFHLTFARSNGSRHFHSCLTVSACLMRIWWFWWRVMQQWGKNVVRFSRQTKWWYV